MKIIKLLSLVFVVYVLPAVAMEQKEDKLRHMFHSKSNLSLVERHNNLVSRINCFDVANGDVSLEQLQKRLSLVDEEIDQRLSEENAFEKKIITSENYNKEKMYE